MEMLTPRRLAMSYARSDLAAATGADGRIYVIGGYMGGNGLRFVEAFRPGAPRWIDVPMIAAARDAWAAVRGPDGRTLLDDHAATWRKALAR